MKVHLDSTDDVRYLNWKVIVDQIIANMRDKIVSAMEEAQAELKTLRPGETKRFPINLGEISISRDED